MWVRLVFRLKLVKKPPEIVFFDEEMIRSQPTMGSDVVKTLVNLQVL